MTRQISALAGMAREEGDYQGEQFMQWFIKEQVEEVSTMGDLLRVIERAKENPLLIEEYLARESFGARGSGPHGPRGRGRSALSRAAPPPARPSDVPIGTSPAEIRYRCAPPRGHPALT